MTRHKFAFLHAAKATKFAKTTGMQPSSLKRQLRSARHILDRLYGQPEEVRGMLLADDVGLGKTTIGAIVAWAAAGEGTGRVVRILAPNKVMRQRWEEELERVLPAMQALGDGKLDIHKQKLRSSDRKLHPTHINVTTQTRAVKSGRLKGELLIIDEAHRSKSDTSQFRTAMRAAIDSGAKVLLLTATPMSIRTEELASLLRLLAGQQIHDAVCEFGKQIRLLYDPNDTRSEAKAYDELVAAADTATEYMKTCVLRHSIDELHVEEQQAFGPPRAEWSIPVPDASHDEIALLARIDRLNRLASGQVGRTNDPRFHVARSPVRRAVAAATASLEKQGLGPLAWLHREAIEASPLLGQDHPKMIAVARAVAERAVSGDKVIVFCHHHLVAIEMTRVLARYVSPYPLSDIPASTWRAVWSELLEHGPGSTDNVTLRRAFIDWICRPSFRDQIASWVRHDRPLTLDALQKTRPPRCNEQSIAESMRDLMYKVFEPKSTSTIGVFRERAGSTSALNALPFGDEKPTRVIGACDHLDPVETHHDSHLFLQENRPDLLLALFNSPFGPDVLVLTDRYSEGIDMHRYCRLLVHYELNPSPMRTIQREGRIRRISNWASAVGQPVQYAMPAFTGTRDERVVEIMRGRLSNFGRLLGGIPSYGEEASDINADERAQRVLKRAEDTLAAFNKRLRLP